MDKVGVPGISYESAIAYERAKQHDDTSSMAYLNYPDYLAFELQRQTRGEQQQLAEEPRDRWKQENAAIARGIAHGAAEKRALGEAGFAVDVTSEGGRAWRAPHR